MTIRTSPVPGEAASISRITSFSGGPCSTHNSAFMRASRALALPSYRFQRDCRRFAPTYAQRCDAALEAALVEGVEQRRDDARPRGADRMAERAGAAIYVDSPVVEVQIVHRG